MTYCVAALVEEGIVFASDSRTAAGFDDIATFSKMNVFEVPGERVIVTLSSGNLATTQGVIARLKMRARDAHGAATPDGILGVGKLFEAVQLVGRTLREVVSDAAPVQQQGVDIGCHFILGGQIEKRRPRLFHIYPEGNFIEASQDTNFFQIGEHKYGKPIMDRVVKYHIPLKAAAKAIIVSFDSTMRSNLTVGLPIDLLAYEKGSGRVTLRRRFGDGDLYFSQLSGIWSAGLRRAFGEVPEIDWGNQATE